MNENANYYELLEVPPTSTDSEIRKAYYRQIRMYSNETHPVEFQLLTKAYKTLSDSEKRAVYDRASQDDGEYDRMMTEGLNASEQGKYDQAIKVFNEVLVKYPGDIGANFQKASALYDLGRLNEAKAIVSRLLRDEQENLNFLELAVLIYSGLKEYSQAISLCEQLISKGRDEPRYYLHLSNIYYDLEQPEKSIEVLERKLRRGESIHDFQLLKELFYFTMIVFNDDYHSRVTNRLRELPGNDDERVLLIDWLIDECEMIGSTHPAYNEFVMVIKRLNKGRNFNVNVWITKAEGQLNNHQVQQRAESAYQQTAATNTATYEDNGTGSFAVAIIIGIIFSFIFTPFGGILAGIIYYFYARFIWRAIGAIIGIIILIILFAACTGAFG
ncbi:hypothetical protein AM500_05150 [Bacillus sp. FJAT-18017]|uniref:J domain-containing protein n=1 Tax=Bacillus sp. FJAT-18017 TaxID=1705566 RepID=UPI0006B0340E|nr:tetratricopeptide repeat protein [Bacillus sp. FJAT-18017]ALC89237.1 hypothetical protein AM500_05150 [Bacillus sp. FJAT-18017]